MNNKILSKEKIQNKTPWNKGKKNVYSKKTIKKMRIAKLGRKLSEEHKEKIGKSLLNHYPWNKGIKYSKKAKKKISLSLKGKNTWMKGRELSEETKKKISLSNKGICRVKMTKKIIFKISQSLKEYYKNNDNPMKGVVGEKHHCWKGGLSLLPYSSNFTKKYRSKIRERDGFRCQLCNKEPKKTLQVHHINYDKKNTNDENLISLCSHCHPKTNFNREYWIEYFSKRSR